MEKGNRNTVLITVIGIATLLVALVGATFAYFTATVTNNASAVTVTTTQVSGLTMTSGTSTTTGPIYPGWLGYQYISVSATGNASSTAKYTLTLNITGSGSGLTSFLGHMQYAICKKTAQTGAAAVADFASSSLASASVNNNQYSMTGGNVALPSTCTAIVADNATTPANGTKLTSAHNISLATAQSITGTKYDNYYIIYRYLNDGDQSTEMGSSFTATPAITAVA